MFRSATLRPDRRFADKGGSEGMARRSIREIRRAELSQAAFDVLVRHGIRATTLERVAAAAGVSKGVVLHHYGDKDALFEAVLRKVLSVLRECVVELLVHAESPEERLYAIVVGNFAPPIFQQPICHAWISLCADAPYNKQSQRIQAVVHARIRSNFISAFDGLVPEEEWDRLAYQLTSVVDGIWIRASLQAEQMPGAEGVEQMSFAINRLLRNDAAAERRFKAAREKMEMLAGLILRSRAFREKAILA